MSDKQTPKENTMQSKFVDFPPADPKKGILYMSSKYKTPLHTCTYKCKSYVLITINSDEDDKPTLNPTLLHKSCGVHYYITKGNVEWA